MDAALNILLSLTHSLIRLFVMSSGGKKTARDDAKKPRAPAAKRRKRGAPYFIVTHCTFDDDYKHRGDAACVGDVQMFETCQEAEVYVRERQRG